MSKFKRKAPETYCVLLMTLITKFTLCASVSTTVSPDHVDLQTAADIHTTDSCLLHDRSLIAAPHSPLLVGGIASLGFNEVKEATVRGSHDNRCDYILRPPDANSTLKTSFEITKRGKAHGLEAKKFSFSVEDEDAAGNSSRGSKRRAGSRFGAPQDLGDTAQVEKGTGTMISFQNDQRMMKRNRRELERSLENNNIPILTERAAFDPHAIDLPDVNHRRVKRGIATQSAKDVYFSLMMEKDNQNDCFDCNGRCLKKDVQCNFINDCNMEDEQGCSNPNNLTIIVPVPPVEVAEPTKPTKPGKEGVIDLTKFEVYLSKCDPADYESCIELATCMDDPRCGPTEGDKFDRAVVLLNKWRENFPRSTESTEGNSKEEGSTGLAWWIPLLICLLVVLIIIIVVVVIVMRRRKKRKMVVADADPNKPTTIHVSASGGELDSNANRGKGGDGGVAVMQQQPNGSFGSSYEEGSISHNLLSNKLQTEFDRN